MSTERPILIVEDDAELREILAERLMADAGLTAVGAGTLEDAGANRSPRTSDSTR